MKRPAYQWYPGDFRRDMGLQACSWEARSLWRDLLDIMHDGQPYGHLSVNGNTIPVERVAAMIGLAVPRVRRYLAELEKAGVPSRTEAGVLYSRRMVRDEGVRSRRAIGGIESLSHPNVPRPKDTLEGYPSDHPSEDPSSRPSGDPLQFASASAVARPSTKKNGSQPKKKHSDATASVGPAGWVNEAVEVYKAIGYVTHGMAGRLLKPIVAEHGWPEVKLTLECFCELAPYTDYLARVESQTLRPGEEKVKRLGYNTKLSTFVEQYTHWHSYLQVGS